MFRQSSRRFSRCLASSLLVSFEFLLVAPAMSEAEPTRSAEQVSTNASTVQKPTFAPGISSVDRWRLTAAFDTAIRQLDRRDTCRALFEGLDLDPHAALVGTLYETAFGALAEARCKGAVTALTMVGGQRTRLCGPFRRLSKTDKTVTLIHEALHRAGMSESPVDPEAPTAREISDRVRVACGL